MDYFFPLPKVHIVELKIHNRRLFAADKNGNGTQKGAVQAIPGKLRRNNLLVIIRHFISVTALLTICRSPVFITTTALPA